MDWDGAEVAAAYNCCWSERKKERRERRETKVDTHKMSQGVRPSRKWRVASSVTTSVYADDDDYLQVIIIITTTYTFCTSQPVCLCVCCVHGANKKRTVSSSVV